MDTNPDVTLSETGRSTGLTLPLPPEVVSSSGRRPKPPISYPPTPGQALGARIILIGGAIEVLGALLSWNTFRVGDFMFRGTSGLPPTGTRLGVFFLGTILILHGAGLQKHWDHSTRIPRVGRARAVTPIAFTLALASLYADGLK